jgi:hypothetical protein
MTSLARNGGDAGALFDLSGTIATNASWAEDVYFTEAGAPFDISELEWKLTFRLSSETTSADVTLSTAAGTLSVVADDNGHYRILRIGVAAGALGAYEGDYIADLASKDGGGAVLLWAQGTVSFRPNPITF